MDYVHATLVLTVIYHEGRSQQMSGIPSSAVLSVLLKLVLFSIFTRTARLVTRTSCRLPRYRIPSMRSYRRDLEPWKAGDVS